LTRSNAMAFVVDEVKGRQLGCKFNELDEIESNDLCAASRSGVFVAGDVSRSVNLVAAAVGKGAQAAYSINVSLVDEERP